jgi:biopolymer transport protein TolR
MASSTIKSADREPIIVSVNQQGDYFLNINTAPESPMDADALIMRVAAELTLAKENKESLQVLVKGDQSVPYGKVVIAMGLLKKAGAEQVGLVTDSSNLPQEKQG